jgi:hypothetical protein
MSGRRISIVCFAMALVALAGCGKKSSSQSSTEPSNPNPIAGGPGPIGPGGDKDKKEPPKPSFETYVADMQTYAGKARTTSTPSGQETLKKLTDNIPSTHERRAEVYKALTQTADKLHPADKAQYVWWATKYAGPENAADLLAIARSYAADVKTSPTSQAAFARLTELKEPSTFAPIAAMLNDSAGLLRLESAKALKSIGSPAEKAVQPYAGPTGPGGKANDSLLRAKAIEILGEIGTKDSIPLLQSMFNDPLSLIANAAKSAVAAIQLRK